MGGDRLIGRRLGGFEVLEVLGRGGFATVYRARQVRLGRDIALKILDPMLARDPDVARRFEREGWAAAGLDHPNIVPVIEAGEEDGVLFLAMRLVQGESLADELARCNRLTPERTAAVVAAVGDGLDHAHSRGVLHRDVKPANILLEDDRVWLSDFGIAAMAQQVGHYTKGAIGTAHYMAPEQARPGAAGAEADLYSLGCVAYECLVGQPPFSGRDFPALLYAHTHEPIPQLGDPRLDAFFGRALAKAPEERFSSGVQLAQEFQRAVGDPTVLPAASAPTVAATSAPTPTSEVDETVTAGQPGSPPSGGRRSRRARALLAVGVLAAGIAAVLIAVFTHNGGSAAPHPTQLATNVQGPAAITDPEGAHYDLPQGWAVDSVTNTGGERKTAIFEAAKPAVLVVSQGGQDESAAAFAARSPDFACPTTAQQPAQLGGIDAVRCTFSPNGQTATSGNEVNVYYANVGHRSWLVRVEPGLAPTRTANFLSSFRFVSS